MFYVGGPGRICGRMMQGWTDSGLVGVRLLGRKKSVSECVF